MIPMTGSKEEQASALYCIVFDAPEGAPADAAYLLERYGYYWTGSAWVDLSERMREPSPFERGVLNRYQDRRGHRR